MLSVLKRATLIVMAAAFLLERKALGDSPGVNMMSISRPTFKAAVYAHVVYIPVDPYIVSRAQAVENMKINLHIYRFRAAQAKQQNADIIVFPEDGIYGMMFTRHTIYPYLEQIPDPQSETWVPCDDPNRHKDSDVQVTLSCIAKFNDLYLVANMGDKQPCDPLQDPKCPEDKRYQFNTNVAYGPDGTFLAKYHKHNLFYEDQFDTAPPSHVYFDTPFGRVGLMTCFDVLYEEPGIPLVEKYNVTVFAFPTGWRDALPLLPALGFHSSFARARGVNFLAANLHLPEFGFDGSGLYAPDGAHAFYYGSGLQALSPKLLVSEMDVLERSHRVGFIATSHQRRKSLTGHKSGPMSIVENSFDQPLYDISSSAQFESVLFYDTYTFKTLDQLHGKLEVCQNQLCCQLEYAYGTNPYKIPEMYAFGAFDGLHTHDGNYYMQNCVIVKCADALNRKSCGQATTTASTYFTKISLQGQFNTPYVYPQMISSDSEGNIGLFKPAAWDFNGTLLETNSSFNSSIISAVLLGRDYGKD